MQLLLINIVITTVLCAGIALFFILKTKRIKKVYEERLKEHNGQDKLSLVATKTDNYVMISDKDDRIEWVNEGFTRLTGYTPEEVIGKKPPDVLRGEFTDTETVERIDKKAKEKKPYSAEILNYNKKGDPIWMFFNITPILNDKGEITRYITVGSDVTERKKGEEALKKQKEQIEGKYKKIWKTSLSVHKQKEEVEKLNTDLNEQKEKLEQTYKQLSVKNSKLWRTSLLVNKHKEEVEEIRAQLATKNKDITDSIQYAKIIQQAILPRISEIQKFLPGMFILYKPKDIVSGDFYWFHSSPPLTPPKGGESQPAKGPSYETADPGLYEKMKEKAAEMRNKPTEGEAILWKYLKDKQTGYKIRRQHIIDRFIGDFVCLDKKLVIEVDGDIHDYQKEEDELRTSVLEDRGFRVIRFKNEEVIAEPEGVVNQIKETLDKPVSPQRGDGRGAAVIIAACDCTGHGVPGAFMSMIGNDLLNNAVIDKGITEPASVLDRLQVGIRFTLQQDRPDSEAHDGMDMALCCLQYTNNGIVTLQYAGANNPLWVVRGSTRELTEIKGDRQPVGIYGRVVKPFTNHTIKLQKGDTFYLFSDGYQDQFGGPKGKKFKSKQFKELLLSIQDKSMEEQREIIDKTFLNWKGELNQIDDILVIGIRV